MHSNGKLIRWLTRLGYLRESRSYGHPDDRQEEVSCAVGEYHEPQHYPLIAPTDGFQMRCRCMAVRVILGPHCGPVCLCDTQAYQARARESHFHICGRSVTTDRGAHERHLRGAQVSHCPQHPLTGSAPVPHRPRLSRVTWAWPHIRTRGWHRRPTIISNSVC